MQRLFGSRVLAVVAVSLFAMAGGALLAWWQWTRYESASGSLQNLGYVLQWPLFGAFPAFMFWRIHRTARRERQRDAADSASAPAAEAPSPATLPSAMTVAAAVTTDTAPADAARADTAPADTAPADTARADTAPVDDGRWTYTQNRTVTYSVDEDVELLAYNQYLADLSANSADREHRHAG